MTKQETAWLKQYENELWGELEKAKRAFYDDSNEQTNLEKEKALSEWHGVNQVWCMLAQNGHKEHLMRCETCAIHETPQCMLTMIEKGHMTFINHDPKFFCANWTSREEAER